MPWRITPSAALHNEAHARPAEELVAPLRLSYLVLLADAALRDRQRQQLCELCAQLDVALRPATPITSAAISVASG